jgi:hypothetical protein
MNQRIKIETSNAGAAFEEIATLLRTLPDQQDVTTRIHRLARQGAAPCKPTIALQQALDDLDQEVVALVREARGNGNVSRIASALGKLETLRLMCG